MRWMMTGLVCLLAAGITMGAEVKLMLEERAKQARVDEPVRIGVPLAKGVARNVERLTLLDETGVPVPCQFTAVGRWLGDESVKWVHLDFATSLDSGAARTFTLSTDAAKNPAPRDPLVIEQGDNVVTVKTAGMAARIRGAKFNFFDSVTSGGKEVVTSADGGIVALMETGRFASALDPDGRLTVESQGPIRTVVTCEGTLKDERGEKGLDYVVRFAFHAGLPRVDAAFTFINRQGQKPADKMVLHDLSILVPTSAPSTALRLLGTQAEPVAVPSAAAKTPPLAPGQALAIFQTTSDTYHVFVGADSARAGLNRWAGKELARGRGKSVKPLTTGWGAVQWPHGGVAVGSRWFWQSFPSIVELRADGAMRLGLYAREGGEARDVYMGQARTTDLAFIFGPAEPARLNATFAGLQQPLRPLPDAKYLCREAAAFGPLGESDPTLYGDLWPRLANYDKVLREQLENHLKRLDGAIYREKWSIDGYGYWPWGDVVLWLYPGEEYPWSVSWSGNYYDFAFACLLQFVRTGDAAFLDQVEPNTIHEADVFTVNHHPRADLVGACRYCPPRNHIGIDGDGDRTGGPYVSVEFNHHKAQSTFAGWYLFGNERLRDVALLKLNNAFSNREADNGWRQIRGPGAQLATLAMGYEFTHERRYLDRMNEIARNARALLDRSGPSAFGHSSGQFMYGIGIEGLIYVYLAGGNPDALAVARALTDYLIDNRFVPGATTCNLAFGLAFLYHETGDPKYREWCLKTIESQKPKTSGELKSFGQSFRSAARAFYYLTIPPKPARAGG
jgi:hypothetical protein